MIGEAKETQDGLEMHMQVNHLSHFLLFLELENCLKNAASLPNSDVRIINVSSDGHKFTMKNGLDIDAENFGKSSWAYSGYFGYHRLYGQRGAFINHVDKN